MMKTLEQIAIECGATVKQIENMEYTPIARQGTPNPYNVVVMLEAQLQTFIDAVNAERGEAVGQVRWRMGKPFVKFYKELEAGTRLYTSQPSQDHSELMHIHNILMDIEGCEPVHKGDTLTVRLLKDFIKLHTLENQLSPVAPNQSAYEGAREDLLIWKKRALEAEEKVRVYDKRIVGLGVLSMETASDKSEYIKRLEDALRWSLGNLDFIHFEKVMEIRKLIASKGEQ